MPQTRRQARYSILPLVLSWLLSPHSLIILVVLAFVQPTISQELRNLSLPVTSSQIVYTPFVCNATTVSINPQACAGAWQLSNSSDPDSTTVSSVGPSSASANIIPQLFLQFRAFNLSMTTLPSSNATMNVTISANGIVVSQLFNSSLGALEIVNLPENDTSLLTITFLASSTPTRFDLQTLTITVPSDSSVTSLLPQPTLPPSISLPIFPLPTSSSTSLLTTPTSSPKSHINRKMIAEAVGLTVGLGLGLTAVALLALYYWKRRRQREMDVSMEETRSGWNRERIRHV
ncbi:hypothetical protein GALMADRAFT_1113777 [Galerina marginata CBS 339.88]|uniref:Uncharacterized protein n=1 Tax=Galerina marginata (strain CBS 339.88) TaxID=685588 RepID=A0A067TLW6_GALM3|nr:hypothetical protein GALMADRAFT_1113777 [Galerina marginata CBS 339.88]